MDVADNDPSAQKASVLREFAARSRVAARNAGIDAAAAEACRALMAAGIEPLLLKGAALARTLYRPSETRAYFDADLLVAPTAVPAAGAVLAELGYANLRTLQGIDDIAGSVHGEPWSRSVPGFGNVTIDLHWRLDGTGVSEERAWEVLRSRCAVIELAGCRLATLDSSGLALHLALHAAQHGQEDLKAMGDLQRGLERWTLAVWDAAARLAAELAATDTFAAGLRLSSTGAIMADELDLPTADAALWAIAHREERPRGTFFLTALTEAGSFHERAAIVRRALFPPRAWIIWEYRWAASGPLRLLAGYAWHLVRTPAWAAKAAGFRRRAGRELR